MPQTPEQREAAFAAAGVPLPATPQTSPIALDALSSPVTPLATVQTPPPAPLPKPPVAPAPQQPTDFVSQVESLTSQLAGKDAVTGARVKQASAQDRERLNQINYEINALNARAVQNQETVRQSGGDTSFQAGEAQRVARNDAIQGMFLAAQQQAILGNIALAEDTAKTAVDAEFATKEQELKTQRQNIIANYDTFTTDQKKRVDAALLAIDKDDQFIKDQKESRQQLQTLALQLAANGVDASIIGQVQKAPSIEAAIKLAAPYVQSPEAKLKLANLQLDIDIAKLQKAKLSKEIAQIGQPTASEVKAAREENAKQSEAKATAGKKAIEALTIIQSLKKDRPGKDAAVGARLPLFNTTNVGGTPAQDVMADVQRLRAVITTEAMQAFKGLGPMSEREFAVAESAGTNIRTDDKGRVLISEAAFNRELARLETAFTTAVSEYASTLSQDEKALLDTAFSSAQTQQLPPQSFYKN